MLHGQRHVSVVFGGGGVWVGGVGGGGGGGGVLASHESPRSFDLSGVCLRGISPILCEEKANCVQFKEARNGEGTRINRALWSELITV